MGYTKENENWLRSLTVEFWFRPGNNIIETDHLFTLYSENDRKQYF